MVIRYARHTYTQASGLNVLTALTALVHHGYIMCDIGLCYPSNLLLEYSVSTLGREYSSTGLEYQTFSIK